MYMGVCVCVSIHLYTSAAARARAQPRRQPPARRTDGFRIATDTKFVMRAPLYSESLRLPIRGYWKCSASKSYGQFSKVQSRKMGPAPRRLEHSKSISK